MEAKMQVYIWGKFRVFTAFPYIFQQSKLTPTQNLPWYTIYPLLSYYIYHI